ncbi:hypothetical protein DBR00_06940 [Pseudomonas sp. HMWF032]|uniref:hypothetical protein n=1 Tax=Pseudomonas sp. HMWF032 TaxID=2056866 RepID=UPI000D39FA8C|nr:hypothetical protein [Pseudomonas sp. HMWF032]PTS85505.1 hypothetical protein DBR00_06940 [Pseudomonas sp. HMWF032]PTT82260.1 hypothetical protein DBR41_14360 [Pseudomonas sp. HMWF010]
MNVSGDNNRVAGRDYIENPIKACPSCENSVIDRDKAKCNRCIKQEKEDAAKGTMSLFGLAVIFVWGLLLQRMEVSGIERLTETFFLSVLIVVMGYFILWHLLPLVFDLIRIWWSSRRQ